MYFYIAVSTEKQPLHLKFCKPIIILHLKLILEISGYLYSVFGEHRMLALISRTLTDFYQHHKLHGVRYSPCSYIVLLV
jgi:hypothetical protein